MTGIAAGVRFIIADDLPHVRISMRAMLTALLGANVVGEAGSAADLIALLPHTAADIIIVDRDIRGLDDPAAVEEIKRLAPHSRIVLVTVFERGGLRYCPLDADLTISKSHGPEQWLAMMEQLITSQPPGVITLTIEKERGQFVRHLAERKHAWRDECHARHRAKRLAHIAQWRERHAPTHTHDSVNKD